MAAPTSPAAGFSTPRLSATSPRASRPDAATERACLLIALLVLTAWSSLVTPAGAQTPGACREGRLPGGALSLICVPSSGWNGDLVLFAHGYVKPGERLRFRHLTLPGGLYLPDVVQGTGHAFATTSYRRNGLAVLEGVEDLRELRAAFAASVDEPDEVLATGVSEGGLVVTLLAERHPAEIDGALAACAPVGGLRRQVDYIGDVRVLFDARFPGVLPGHPVRVPARVRRDWERVHRPRIRAAVRRREGAARRVIRAAGAAVDPRSRRSVADTLVNALWYGVHATADLAARLGGNPYDNVGRRYSRPGGDRGLDRRVRRIRGSRTARANLAAYEPSGALRIPLTLLHTTGDEVVPLAHQAHYAGRVARAGAVGLLETEVVRRYGHCRFRPDELLGAFTGLAARVRSAG